MWHARWRCIRRSLVQFTGQEGSHRLCNPHLFDAIALVAERSRLELANLVLEVGPLDVDVTCFARAAAPKDARSVLSLRSALVDGLNLRYSGQFDAHVRFIERFQVGGAHIPLLPRVLLRAAQIATVQEPVVGFSRLRNDLSTTCQTTLFGVATRKQSSEALIPAMRRFKLELRNRAVSLRVCLERIIQRAQRRKWASLALLSRLLSCGGTRALRGHHLI